MKALRHYRRALRRDRRKVVKSVWFNLGLLRMETGHHREAATCFQNFLQHRPDDARGFGHLGLCHLQLGDYRSAVSNLKKGIYLAPSPEMFHYMATAYLSAGKRQESIEAYRRALRLFPKTQFLYYHLGLTYYRAEQTQQAIQMLRKVTEFGADSELSGKAREWMERIQTAHQSS